MPYVPAIATCRIDAPRAPSIAIATITTSTDTIRTGVRTRVHD